MPLEQLIILIVMAALVTPLAVSYIPRARHSPTFDRLLWAATFVLGFLGGWFAIGYGSQYKELDVLNDLLIAEVPVMVVLIGAAAGAFALNLSLWVIDRFSHDASVEEIEAEEWDGPTTESDSATVANINASEQIGLDDQPEGAKSETSRAPQP